MSKLNENGYDARAELDLIQREGKDFVARILAFCERQQSHTPEVEPITQAMEQSSFVIRSATDTFALLAKCYLNASK